MRFLIATVLVTSVLGGRIPRPSLNGKISDKIVGGQVTEPNQFPFTVSVQRRGLVWAHFCAGIVYNENWIITAAQCIDGINNINNARVVAGEHSFGDEVGDEQRRGVNRTVRHPYFYPPTFENDVGLIRLDEPLDFGTGTVAPVTLPAVGQNTPAGTNVTIAGWGSTFDGGVVMDRLRAASLPVVSDEQCRSNYDPLPVADSMICAGLPQGGVDSCIGDSGGPLFTNFSGETPTTLLGVVSWGTGCALAGYPGVYTEVSYFVDWIRNNARD